MKHICIFVFILGIICLTIYGQFPGHKEGAGYKIKKINLTNLVHAEARALTWTVTSDDSSVFFFSDWHEDKGVYLRSFILSPKGKASRPLSLFSSKNSRIEYARAFWIDHEADDMPPHGLLFFSHNQFLPKEKIYRVSFFSARFNTTGQIIGEFNPLFEIDSSGTKLITHSFIGVGRRGNNFGVVIGLARSKSEDRSTALIGSEAYFLETDAAGIMMESGIKAVNIPNKGKLQIFRPYDPEWNGKSWMTPVVLSVEKIVYVYDWEISEIVYNKLMTLVTTPNFSSGKVRTKLRKLVQDNTPQVNPFTNIYFFPNTDEALSPAAEQSAASKLDLFYMKELRVKGQNNFNDRTYEHYIQPVNKRGKKAGPVVEVFVPEWRRQIASDSKWALFRLTNIFSAPLLFDERRVLIAHSRSAEFNKIGDWNSWRNELQLDLYVMDTINGEIDHWDSGNYLNKYLWHAVPLLQYFNHYPAVVNNLSGDHATDPSAALYFSKLK